MTTQPAGISSQCRRTDRLLWAAYGRSECQSAKTNRCRLIFPERESKKLRVSEQEARFAFVEALCTGGRFRYSVETPTSKRYQFQGEKETSAQTDLTVYDLDTRRRLCNVEFKKGGWSMKGEESNGRRESNRNSVFPIYKDVLKLLHESAWGLWFHLLDRTTNSTIPNLLEVIWKQIDRVQEKLGECAKAPGLTLHVCALEAGFSLQKDVGLPLDVDELKRRLQNADELKSHLNADLHVPPRSTLNGWKINQRKCKFQS